MSSLNDIGQKYGTDKSSLHHNYLDTYELYLYPLRDKPIKMLEIGFGGYNDATKGGESLWTWLEYFPKAEITCLEYYPKQFSHERVNLIIGDQSDHTCLSRIGKDFGPFDLIVDDGSHISAHIIKSFTSLFTNYLKSGGIYIVEDTSTAWEPKMAGDFSSIDFFKSNIDLYNHNVHKFQANKMSPFRFIHFYNQLIICQKGLSDII